MSPLCTFLYDAEEFSECTLTMGAGWVPICEKWHIPTDLVVLREASDVESSSRLDFLLLHNLRRRFIA